MSVICTRICRECSTANSEPTMSCRHDCVNLHWSLSFRVSVFVSKELWFRVLVQSLGVLVSDIGSDRVSVQVAGTGRCWPWSRCLMKPSISHTHTRRQTDRQAIGQVFTHPLYEVGLVVAKRRGLVARTGRHWRESRCRTRPRTCRPRSCLSGLLHGR